MIFARRNFLKFLYVPARGTCNLQRATAPSILLGLGSNTGTGKSSLRLPFALRFGSIRAFSAKRTISNFRSNSPRRGTCTNLHRAIAPSILLGLGSTIQGSVSLLFSFLSHYFQLHPSLFLKELSQFFAPIPGGPHATSNLQPPPCLSTLESNTQ
jgi:hypothetical protein